MSGPGFTEPDGKDAAKQSIVCPLCGTVYKMRCHLVTHMHYTHGPQTVSMLQLCYRRKKPLKRVADSAGCSTVRLRRAVGPQGSSLLSSAGTYTKTVSMKKGRPPQKLATLKKQHPAAAKAGHLKATLLRSCSTPRMYRCQWCGHLFRAIQGLVSHENAHRRSTSVLSQCLVRRRSGGACNSLATAALPLPQPGAKKKKMKATQHDGGAGNSLDTTATPLPQPGAKKKKMKTTQRDGGAGNSLATTATPLPQPGAKKKKMKATQHDGGAGNSLDTTATPLPQPGAKKKKMKTTQRDGGAGNGLDTTATPLPQPGAKKKKMKATQRNDGAGNSLATTAPPLSQPGTKKKKKASQHPPPRLSGSYGAAAAAAAASGGPCYQPGNYVIYGCYLCSHVFSAKEELSAHLLSVHFKM